MNSVKTIKIKHHSTIKALKDVPLEISNENLIKKCSDLYEIREGSVILYTKTGAVLEKGKKPTMGEFIRSQISQNPSEKKLYNRLCHLTMMVKVDGGPGGFVKTVKILYNKIKHHSTIKALKDVPLEISNENLSKKCVVLFGGIGFARSIRLYTKTGAVLEMGKKLTMGEFIRSQISQNPSEKKLYNRLCLTMMVVAKGGGFGGTKSFEPSPENRIDREVVQWDAPYYYRATHGLNLEYKCRYCKKSVVVKVGYLKDPKNLGMIVVGNECPNKDCEKVLDDEDYHIMWLYLCKYEYEGYARENKKKVCGNGVCDDPKKIITFNGSESGNEKLTWVYLNMKVTPL